jgi:hypothetical protein
MKMKRMYESEDESKIVGLMERLLQRGGEAKLVFKSRDVSVFYYNGCAIKVEQGKYTPLSQPTHISIYGQTPEIEENILSSLEERLALQPFYKKG